MSSLDDLIERLAEIRRMRAAYGGDYRQLVGCESCQAPPGAHWPDCDRTSPYRPVSPEDV